MKIFISTSKSKKNSARSKFFSALMGKLAGDRGNQVSEMFASRDADGFEKEMTKIVSEITQSIRNKK